MKIPRKSKEKKIRRKKQTPKNTEAVSKESTKTVERKTEDSRLFHIEYPLFYGEENKRKNQYFQKLTEGIKNYCQKETFPENTKYYANYVILYNEENEDHTDIAVELGLRRRGRFTARKKVLIRWEKDFIIKQEIKDTF